MKLGQALVERADLQKRLEQLQQRLINNAKKQAGIDSSEDPIYLLTELEQITTQLTELIQRINQTNAHVPFNDAQTIAEAIAQRDILTKKTEILRSFFNEASTITPRYSQSEIQIQSTVDTKKLRQRIDHHAEEIRVLDVAIQEKNWTTDLL